ncbi:major facilitator superfamily domain-containing protein [Gloeopeniophorella convolvens]|nr:major facilitator superfamily domain-containing protein [Gloeopeniophorella convolvens]
MQEDLGLHGNQLNYITTSWTVGYVIGQIPSNILITRVRPSIWVPAMELTWSALTMCLAFSKNFSTLCAIRFLVGLQNRRFIQPSSWYKKEELAKRLYFHVSARSVHSVMSNLLSDGERHRGWKWLFIIDGVITFPCLLDLSQVLGFFSTWHYMPLYHFNNGSGGANSMIFWLKSFNKPGHTVYTIVQILTTLTYAWWSDAVVARWPPMLFAGTWSIITYVVLARWTFYYFTGCSGGLSGLIMAWIECLTRRAFVVASCNMWAYVIQAWLPIVIFPQVEQPRVFKGNVATACINFSMMTFAMITLYFERRDNRLKATRSEDEIADDVTEDDRESVKTVDLKKQVVASVI